MMIQQAIQENIKNTFLFGLKLFFFNGFVTFIQHNTYNNLKP